MSRHHYLAGKEISRLRHEYDWPFYGLIQAAMREADTDNLRLLRSCWPDVWEDLSSRYFAPGGWLPGETEPADE